MANKVKKNRHRKTDPYIPVCILLLGAVVVIGSISLGGEKEESDNRLVKIIEWERKEEKTVEALPKKMKYEVNLEIPLQVKITEHNQPGELKIIWQGCEDAMAYDICIDDGDSTVYEEVYDTQFIHKNMNRDKTYRYKVRARRYGLYTYWSSEIIYKPNTK